MSTRTARIYRDDSLFEWLEEGPVVLGESTGAARLRRLSGLIGALILLAAIPAALFYFLEGNRVFTLVLGGMWFMTALILLNGVLRRLSSRRNRKRAKVWPAPVGISDEGVSQAYSETDIVSIPWMDIRLVRWRRDGYLIKGTEKGQEIEIDARLVNAEKAAAIIEYAFMLHQTLNETFNSITDAVRRRMDKGEIKFFYGSDRGSSIGVSRSGITSIANGQDNGSMSWEQLRNSVCEDHKKFLRLRHVSSDTNVDVHAGAASDILLGQILAWGLHTNPPFEKK